MMKQTLLRVGSVSRRMNVWSLTSLLLMTACAAEADSNLDDENEGAVNNRHPLGKADNVGSCEGLCGSRYPDGCFCDAECEDNGDCCDDYQAQCIEVPPEDETSCDDGVDNDGNGFVDCDDAFCSDNQACVVNEWVAQVCYPGSGDYTTCFNTVAASDISLSAYNYPASDDGRYKAPKSFLDLDALDLDTQLSSNFKLSEFVGRHKGRYAIVSPNLIIHSQGMRNYMGSALTINSGYRSPGYNAGISGSAVYSRHQWGDGADFDTPDNALTKIWNACEHESASFKKRYTGHIHCDWRNEALNPAFFGPRPASFLDWQFAMDYEWADLEAQGLWADIDVAPNYGISNSYHLAAVWGEGFDEGTPWVGWEIYDADSGELVFETENITAIDFDAPKEEGRYIVVYNVGGVFAETLDLGF